MKVVWSSKSMDSLLGIYNYIFEKSPQNALMVFNELTKLGDSLSNNKIEYSKDLIINDKAVRFVSKWDYKIIYERKENRVLIIDVFSSKQNPNKLILD
ncbi:type II toxin-antitoxin system RelE/ParE family toxin [Polaribacter batillariae]|nr:type II toxin-antitoxin system RelE/ParE family toxin [Polaribacter batillariae]